ncbi:MAG: hypothetical protein ACLUVY_05580 [Bacteroides uniformis]
MFPQSRCDAGSRSCAGRLFLRTAEKVDVLRWGRHERRGWKGCNRHGWGRTFIIEETDWLGGGMLTAAGVSAVDGNHRLRAGI